MADQPDALVLHLKIQHLIVLRKIVSIVLDCEECLDELNTAQIAWLTEIEGLLWPARRQLP